MFFIDSSDIKFGTFLNCIFHNMINEIGSIKYQQNCGQSFRDGGGGSTMPLCQYMLEANKIVTFLMRDLFG